MSEEATVVIGDHRVDATGSVILVSRGEGVFIRAGGMASDLELQGENSAKIMCGPATIAMTGPDPAQGNIGLYGGQLGSITQLVGLPGLGAQIKVGPEEVTISVGPPGVGASITMTPASISFKVAEVSFTMTPQGITEAIAAVSREATLVGHTLTAAETMLGVAVQGITQQAPTKNENIEGGAVVTETLASNTTDGAKNVQAGIMMIQ